jgi:hypothetical protein
VPPSDCTPRLEGQSPLSLRQYRKMASRANAGVPARVSGLAILSRVRRLRVFESSRAIRLLDGLDDRGGSLAQLLELGRTQ